MALGTSECGIKGSSRAAGARVVNGQQADACEWKWQACLKSPGLRGCWCGGTLVGERWVLSAAHCMAEGGDVAVMLGEWDQTDGGDGTEVEIMVAQVVSHPLYNDNTMDHDFALLRLASAAPLGSCVGLACLPPEDAVVGGGVTCYISGWGTLSSGGEQPSVIQEGGVQTLGNSDCRSKYGTSLITENMLCAQGERNGEVVDACQGDSGGPLVCETGGKWFVQGATSWGFGCASRIYPGVYARVTSVIQWITTTMGEGPPPTPQPTPAPAFGPGQMFLVTSGACTVESFCVQSPNYPANYGLEESCVIAVNVDKADRITVVHFETEEGFDIVAVNGAEYSGDAGPGGIRPTAAITWTSDFVIGSGGWKLCPSSHVVTQAPTEAPDPTPSPPPTLPPVCGAKGTDDTPWRREGRIVNGQAATACEWKWQVGLKPKSAGSITFCGGTLIHPRWVLTAAHCIGDQTFDIIVGDFDLGSDSDAAAIVIEVDDVIPHPNYDDSTFDFDFALAKLVEAAPLGSCIGTVCLPSAELATNSACFITGWGTLEVGGDVPQQMQEAQVRSLSNLDCELRYGSGAITGNMVCAQGTTIDGQTTDACQGDSGGPLVCENGAGRFELHGVTSFGYGCADAGFPGVWARVSKVTDWIDSHVGQMVLPTPAPTPSLPFLEGELWRVLSGECSLDEDSCIRSPNFPASYGSDESCLIAVVPGNTQPIVAQSFQVEEYFDALLINGWIFTGRSGPSGIIPTARLTWTSDSLKQDKGWKLCPVGPTPAPPPTPFCEDEVPVGELQWYDSEGEWYNCEWYASEADRCAVLGNSSANFGMTANEACCACRAGQRWDWCQDIVGDALDAGGYDCFWGYMDMVFCGYYDDDDFSAGVMCCECGGGLLPVAHTTSTTSTTRTTTVTWTLPKAHTSSSSRVCSGALIAYPAIFALLVSS